MEDEINNLIKVYLSVLTSLLYCYFISSKITKGKFRLLSLLPIIYLFTILPLLFSYLLPNAIATLFITWLANFKLLLFAFGQGPLCDQPKSLLQFISIASLPIKIKQNENNPSSQNPQPAQNSPSKSPRLPLNWPAKVMIFTLFVGLHDYEAHMHPKTALALYCCMAYLLVDILFGMCNYLVHAVLNMELESPSNEPYFSTSLQDFWGRRWNLMVTNILRHTIYKPVRTLLESMLGQLAPLPAVLAAFVVSGLMHELLFYRVTRASPTWEVTWFFVLHGVCLVVEFGLKRLCAGRWRLHPAVSGLLTVGFVVATDMWLFLPPVVRAGAADRAVVECKMLLSLITGQKPTIN